MSEFIKIFMEGYGSDIISAEPEVAEEGWGTALARVAGIFGPAPISPVGQAARTVIGIISNDKLAKMLKNPQLKKYLEDQCNKLLKEEQRKDKSVVAKIPGDPITLIKRWWHNNDEVGFWSRPNFMQQHDDWIDDKIFDLKVGQFTTTFWYDTDHIDAAVVIFYSKDRDACLGRRIPAPTNKELAEIFKAE